MVAGSIALVGNGPVGRRAASTIDGHDVVVRINRAPLCGAAGTRTDILAMLPPVQLTSIAEHSLPINPRALGGARELWFLAEETPAEAEAAERLALGRPVRWFGPALADMARRRLRPHQPTGKLTPSTGLILIFALLALMPEADIVLFGFTHEGSKRHLWSGERRLVEDLIDAGRIRRGADDGESPVRLPLGLRVAMQSRRVLNHLRAGRF